MQRELRLGKFKFRPATGKRIPKKGKGQFRPIVVAPIENRIVQRAVLDRLLEFPDLHKYINTPFSFGGIKKGQDEEYGGVPAAIEAVLKAKSIGLNFVRCADISAFFTRIRKSKVREIIGTIVNDKDFLSLFDGSIRVELENLEKLREDASYFPITDLGVAQGSALSPLMGNILLYDFDKKMNDSDCRVFRYIDDIIFIGPTEKSVNAKFRQAERILCKLEMEFSKKKSSQGPKNFDTGFNFLGIELVNGFIRPDSDAIGELKRKINIILENSKKEMLRNSESFNMKLSLVQTLLKLSGTILGWGKHYRFCNDMKTFSSLDVYVDEIIKEYLKIYQISRNKNPEFKRNIIGVGSLCQIDFSPMLWPK